MSSSENAAFSLKAPEITVRHQSPELTVIRNDGGAEDIFSQRLQDRPWQRGVKRCTDVLLASAGLAALSPMMAMIALLVKLDSPGPVLYKSLRIGKNNKPFHMLKFRTMRPDADSLRDRLRQEAQLEGQLFKIANDPRVTPFGRFLRAFSLDEFPQLINVLKGEMSLVGPRPLPPDESVMFKQPYTLRFDVHPGITGLWQVRGRSSLTFEQLCRLELSYVTRWSCLEDWKILLETIPAVLLRRGAC